MIPENWTQLLNKIRTVTPAVIAGGAIRDLDNERPVKDIDIFIEAKDMNTALFILNQLSSIGIEVDKETNEEYPADANLEVVLVCTMIQDDKCLPILKQDYLPPVQLIFTNWPIDKILDRFDYGICKIKYDGSHVIASPEYYEDCGNKVFRLRRKRNTPLEERASVLRYARLLEKYPEWDWQPFYTEDPWELKVC